MAFCFCWAGRTHVSMYQGREALSMARPISLGMTVPMSAWVTPRRQSEARKPQKMMFSIIPQQPLCAAHINKLFCLLAARTGWRTDFTSLVDCLSHTILFFFSTGLSSTCSGHLHGMFPAESLTRGLLCNDFWLVLHTSLLFGKTQHSLVL